MLKNAYRSLLLIVVSLLLALPVAAQTVDYFTVTTTTLNARTGPGIEYSVVGRLGRGSQFQVLQYSPTRNWVLLDLGYAQAWAFRPLGEIDSFRTSVVTTTTNPVINTAPAVNTNSTDAAILGQGGGFAPPVVNTTATTPTTTETGVDLTVTQSTDQFNSTFGVTSTLRIRFAPTFSSRIVGFIPFDQRATPTGRNYNGTWIQVEYEGTTGWVYFLYVVFPPAIDVINLPVTG